jgi:hypothetical protein
VTLNTGPALCDETAPICQQGPGQPALLINYNNVNGLLDSLVDVRIAAARPFLPGGKICRFSRFAKLAGVIASRECGLY